MSNADSLVDLRDGTAVSNASPQSPPSSTLLDTPITLDFDPMSFQFKEDSPLTSPSDNSRELGVALSPSQNLDVVEFFDPFCPVKEESPTEYYPNEILGECNTLIDYSSEPHLPSNENEVNFDPFRPSTLSLNEFRDEVESNNIDESTDIKFNTDTEVQSASHAHDDDSRNLIGDNQHVIDQDEVFTHEEYIVTYDDDSQMSRSGKTSSYISKEEPEKKATRKSSSSSSGGNCREDENISKFSKKEEISIKKTAVYDRNSLKSERINYYSHNGVAKTNGFKDCVDTDYERNVSSECPVSVTELRSTYVHQTAQEKLSVSSSKEIIETSIDIRLLKSSYTEHVVEDRDISPNRETISTGIDIKALKSSFTKTEEETQSNNVQEVIKPSVDRAKVQRTFSQTGFDDVSCLCKICGKHVYQMEKMKAEKNVFHKNCFRCKECNKLLNVDTYSSHEGDLYCKPHFKQLFQPKARFDGEDGAPTTVLHTDNLDSDEGRQRCNELIIRENTPAELPPDVVRSDSKPDHGLESLPINLSNLKSKFEAYKEEHHLPSTTDVCTLQRSASVMARLAKYQSAVSGENNENGDISESESEGEGEDPTIIKPTKHKEKVVFSGMSSLKSQWETGSVAVTKEERNEEKKEELNKLRQKICLGRSESMKAVYEKACQESSKATSSRTEPVVLGREIKATHIKEKFEKGDLVSEVDEERLEKVRREKEEELSVFTEPGIATDAKKLFKEIDATVKTTAVSPISPNKSPLIERKDHSLHTNQMHLNETDVVKCSEPTAKEEIPVDTTNLSQRFKFFENYSESPKERKRFQITPPREPVKERVSPEREVMPYPNVVRAVDSYEEIPSTDTTRRMLDKFKALEKETPTVAVGLKPLKRITPPREYTKDDSHDSSPEPERDPNIVRASYKIEDDIVVEADKAKSLRAKFENWDIELRENKKNEEEEEEEYLPQVDTTKILRAKFEAIKEDTLKPLEKSQPKVNRFIECAGTNVEMCSICSKKVYPMEKMETSGMRLHKNCFRCAHCNCMLRLENYTTSGGRLYCTPHFKQLFISKGNYDEGFGREQHKEKWNRSSNNTPTPRDLQENGDVADYSNGGVQFLEQTV